MEDKNKTLYVGLGVLGLALLCYAGYAATQTQEEKKPEAPKAPVQVKVKEEVKCPV